jgi:hypothetical protein
MSHTSIQGEVESIEDLNVIVDADGHISETMNDILPYVNNPKIKQILKTH